MHKIFPNFSFDQRFLKFPIVQKQPNGNDCGLFAIAFAVSLVYNYIKPEKVKYNQNLMRSHLIKIFECNVIEHFPQDPSYGISQKVLPLSVVRQREFDAACKRAIKSGKNEGKKPKMNEVSKTFDIRQLKKENNQVRILLKSKKEIVDNVIVEVKEFSQIKVNKK